MRRVILVLILASSVGFSGRSGKASDFWDEVREPGLREWRRQITMARTALRARAVPLTIAAASRAIDQLPVRAEAYVVRGRGYGMNGELPKAVDDLRRALELDPTILDEPEDGGAAALILARGADYERASQVLTHVLARMPNVRERRELYELHGDVLQALGPDRLHDATLAYHEGLRAVPNSFRSTVGLALLLRRQERIEEAESLLEGTRRDGPHPEPRLDDLPLPSSECAARRGVLALAMNDMDAARAAFAEVASTSPWYEHAQRELERLNSIAPTGPLRRGGRR